MCSLSSMNIYEEANNNYINLNTTTWGSQDQKQDLKHTTCQTASLYISAKRCAELNVFWPETRILFVFWPETRKFLFFCLNFHELKFRTGRQRRFFSVV